MTCDVYIHDGYIKLCAYFNKVVLPTTVIMTTQGYHVYLYIFVS